MEISDMGITEKLLNQCQSILEYEVDPEMSLVSQGATSMKLMQLVGRIYEEFNVIVDITDLMENVSINSLATILNETTPSNKGAEQQVSVETPLNDIQLLFWELQEYSECKKSYNEGVSHIMIGNLNLNICKQILFKLVERQPELRTAYYLSNGIPVHRVLEMSEIQDKLELEVHDFRNEKEPMEAVERAHRELYSTDFNLAKPPNFRIAIWQIESSKWIVSWVVFHIVTDWWAVDILRKEAARIYRSLHAEGTGALDLPEVLSAKSDITNYDNIERDEGYWRSIFETLPAEINLSSLKRPPIKSYKGEVHLAGLNNINYGALDQVRKQLTITMSSLTFSAFNILVSAISDKDDITTGVPFLNRQKPEIQNAVGIFVNSLPIRIKINKNLSVAEFIQACHRELLAGYKHGRYPARSIKRLLNVANNLSRSPLYEQLFTYYDNTLVEGKYPDMDLSVKEIELPRGTSKYDITFFVTKQADSLHTKIEYTKALFSHDDITKIADTYQDILEHLEEKVDQTVGDLISYIRGIYLGKTSIGRAEMNHL